MPSLHVETPKPIRLRVVDERPIGLHVADEEPLSLSVGEFFDLEAPPYDGEYEAQSMFVEQAFPTEDKMMLHDFTVHAINYTEAPNEYGTTVTIGG